MNSEYEEEPVAPKEGSGSLRPVSTVPRDSSESISLVSLSRPQLSRSMAFLQLQEQVDQATLVARRTVSTECLGARREIVDLEREVGEPRRGSRLKLTFPDDREAEEPEDLTDSSGDVGLEEPIDQEDLGFQRENQQEDLENIRWQRVQEWQRSHDSPQHDRLQQPIRLPSKLEREKEAFYRQLQQDRDKQERELRLLAEQSRHELSREKLTLRALWDQGDVD
uniref:Uncharacterized protein n=1 Tax=Sphaerodactylus townsendi TaxID=933632 RepID=A0ACB8FTD4_9SAUR